MALSANKQYRTSGKDKLSLVVADGSTIYAGALVAIGGPGHASAGYALPYSDAANLIPVGIAQQKVVGDGAETIDVFLDGFVARNTVVGGTLAGTIADVGKKVYFHDDGTLSITAPTTGERFPVAGYIVKHIDADQADVYLFGAREWLVLHDAEGGEVAAA